MSKNKSKPGQIHATKEVRRKHARVERTQIRQAQKQQQRQATIRKLAVRTIKEMLAEYKKYSSPPSKDSRKYLARLVAIDNMFFEQTGGRILKEKARVDYLQKVRGHQNREQLQQILDEVSTRFKHRLMANDLYKKTKMS